MEASPIPPALRAGATQPAWLTAERASVVSQHNTSKACTSAGDLRRLGAVAQREQTARHSGNRVSGGGGERNRDQPLVNMTVHPDERGDPRLWRARQNSGVGTMAPPPESRRATHDGQDWRNCSAEMPLLDARQNGQVHVASDP